MMAERVGERAGRRASCCRQLRSARFAGAGRLSSSTLPRGATLGRISRSIFIFTVAVALAGCSTDDQPTRVVRDPRLRSEPVFLYQAADTTRPPRAVIFFFGNDIGFWRPHRQLAASLARTQFAVAGFDMRPLLRRL